MRRVIVDYKKLNNDILDLLVTKYPDGYDEDHIITFKNALNEVVECVEVKTDDTTYLVKISKRLVAAMEDYDPDEEQDDHDDRTLAAARVVPFLDRADPDRGDRCAKSSQSAGMSQTPSRSTHAASAVSKTSVTNNFCG